jgi:hypothetical protein
LTETTNTYTLFCKSTLKVCAKIAHCPTFNAKRAVKLSSKNISGLAQRVSCLAYPAAKCLLCLLCKPLYGTKVFAKTSSGPATNVLICRYVAAKLIKKPTLKSPNVTKPLLILAQSASEEIPLLSEPAAKIAHRLLCERARSSRTRK